MSHGNGTRPARMVLVALRSALTIASLGGSMQAAEVQIGTVLVGNPGNPNDKVYPSSNNPDNLGFGAVDYEYRIGTYEVTNAQYVEFLNAKAKVTDPLLLYNENMATHPAGGIVRSGSEGNYSYSVRPNMGNKPVTYVNIYDAYRFINWMSNGQGAGDTETGSYTLGPYYPGGYPEDPTSVVRNAGYNWYLPNENEWYKAAYYDPRTTAQGGPAGNDHYWYFPTRSDALPIVATADSVGNISNPGFNVANFDYGADWNGSDGNVTTVGSAGPLSTSYYGTYDQMGNVWEWNDTQFGETGRGLSGGSWSATVYNSAASTRNIAKIATGSYPWIGFRVALAKLGGDANSNGFVDGADYTVWADHYLATGQTWATGDFNGDGIVDGADYTVWSDNYRPAPAQPLGAAAVPEPTTWSLGLLACACLAAGKAVSRRRGQSHCW